MQRALNFLVRVNSAIAVMLFGALTVVVSLQVLTRFVLHRPFIWSEEVARFLFFWVVLLGAALSVKNRRHFAIDVTLGRVDALRQRTRLWLNLVPDLSILAFAVFLLVQGIGYARTGLLRNATNSGLNMGLVYAAIPLFAALTIMYALGNVIADFRRSQLPPRTPESAE